MDYVKQARRLQAEGIAKALEKRNMIAHICADRNECREMILSLIPAGSSVSWGGSESMKQCALPEALKAAGQYTVLDRGEYPPEKMQDFYVSSFCSDYFLMGTNAITLDGELINVDGNGNRVASLIFGPKHVFVIAGMNKVVPDVAQGYIRTRNLASPPNTLRLAKNTPCASLGKCGDCLSPDCICNQIVVTRRSRDKERIHVFLVCEDLGF